MDKSAPTFNDISEKLLAETARMPWRDLQRFFAQGAVLVVDPTLDLVETATAFAKDEADTLEPLLQELKIKQPSNDQARHWYSQDSQLWTVVVAPYVLVQDK